MKVKRIAIIVLSLLLFAEILFALYYSKDWISEKYKSVKYEKMAIDLQKKIVDQEGYEYCSLVSDSVETIASKWRDESSQEKETPEDNEIPNFINERLLGTWYTDGGLPTPDRYVIYPDYIEVYGKTFDSDYKLYNTCSYECIKTDYGYYIKLEGGWGYRYEFEYPDCLTYIGKGDPYSNDGYSGSSSLTKMDW